MGLLSTVRYLRIVGQVLKIIQGMSPEITTGYTQGWSVLTIST